MILRCLRGWDERDDRHLFKVPDVDPVDELIHVLDEAQERDAADERWLIPRCTMAKRCPVRGEDQLAFGRADDW